MAMLPGSLEGEIEMAPAAFAKERTTFVCASCRATVDHRLAVDYKPAKGPAIRICVNCEDIFIGFGEVAGMNAIHQAAIDRDTHLVQAQIGEVA